MVLYGTREATLSQVEVITEHSTGLRKEQMKTHFAFVFCLLPFFIRIQYVSRDSFK